MSKSTKPQETSVSGIKNVTKHSDKIAHNAMALTDAWGAMFEMTENDFARLAHALGFTADIASRSYKSASELNYVTETLTSTGSERFILTWHGADDVILAIRGVSKLSSAYSAINDAKLRAQVKSEAELLARAMAAMPEYSARQMFSPEVAANVLAVHGATVTADGFFKLAQQQGGKYTIDKEARRGVSAQFIRGVSAMLAATV